MQSFNDETIAKLKTVGNAEDLLSLAKESGMELTLEQAQSYFNKLNPRSGELEDEELDNVAGGGCGDNYSPGGRPYVRSNSTCEFFESNCSQAPADPNKAGSPWCMSCRYVELGLETGMNFNLCMNPRNIRQ